MGKLTKAEAKAHREAEDLLEQDTLTIDERVYVLENWNPMASNIVGEAGAFFTPPGLARDLAVMAKIEGRVVDLCAGIGMLAFWFLRYTPEAQLTCIEINPEYVAIGKKIVPEATWINADVLAENTWTDLPVFDVAISNPPFGNVATANNYDWLQYRGPMELRVAELALRKTRSGLTAILPQNSCPFRYSGNRGHEYRDPNRDVQRLLKTFPRLSFECCSVDTSYHQDGWKGVSPSVEMADICIPAADEDGRHIVTDESGQALLNFAA